MNNKALAVTLLNQAIDETQDTDYKYHHLKRLEDIKLLLTSPDKPSPTIINKPALRAVPMNLFPTMQSLDSVLDKALNEMPITDSNDLMNIIFSYHNTLLKEVKNG